MNWWKANCQWVVWASMHALLVLCKHNNWVFLEVWNLSNSHFHFFFFFFQEKTKLGISERWWHTTSKDYWRWNDSTQKYCDVNTLKFTLMDNYPFCFILCQDVDTTWSIKSSSSLLCVNSWKPHCDRFPGGTSCNLLWCAVFILAVFISRRLAEDASFRRATDAGVDSLSWCFNMSVLLEPRCFWDCINKPTGVWVEHVSFDSCRCQDIIHHTSAAVPLFSGVFQWIALVVKMICHLFFFLWHYQPH